MNTARRLITNPHAFDQVIVTLAGIIVFGAYVTAYAYVISAGKVDQQSMTVGQSTVVAGWLALVAVLFAEFAYGVRNGRPWDRALPEGYVGSLAAALIFGIAWLVDTQFWAPAEKTAIGLDALFTPPRLVEIAAVAVIVSGPLRAAARRGETEASPVTLLSTALLLSVITFATQFIHPLIDPWALTGDEFQHQVHSAGLDWIGENMGVASILAQALILAGTALLLNSSFNLRRGSLTFVFVINGLLVMITKLHYQFVPVMVATGLAGDAWLWWSSRRPGRPSASLCAVVGGAFVASYAAEVGILSSVWSWSLWAGAIVATVMMCWLMGRLLRAGLPPAMTAALPAALAPETAPQTPAADESRQEERWTRDPQSPVRAMLVRAALDDLGTPEALARSPLAKLPGISQDGGAAADLRAVLVDVISELAKSATPRDAEAGKILLDYYVTRVGSHELIMERRYLTKPTYYRRLRRGFEQVAERIDEMSEFATRVPVAP